jgi:hypothetical protein
VRYRALVVPMVAATLTACATARHTAGQTTQPPQAPAESAPRRTIFLPAMDGYEKSVAGALAAADVPVGIVPEKAKADLQVRPAFSRSDSSIGAVLYAKRTGHEPFSYLDVVEVETNRVLLSYPFLWSDFEVTRSRDAQGFARELKKKLAPKAKRTG